MTDLISRLYRYGKELQVCNEAADEIERLTQALKKANDQAEHFEREWYLRGDEEGVDMTLPPLPEPAHEQVEDYSGIALNKVVVTPLFNADQMRAYAEQAVAAERERCIDIVAMFGGSVEIEAAIRRAE